MITYLYWALVIGLIVAAVQIIGVKMNNRMAALISAAVILASSWAAYYFHFEQIFVKRWGGVMTISVPAGQHHMGATWKDENLWIENYNPETNTCNFSEYSKGNLLQGSVTIKNCNPLMPQ
jgi:disulfide bond formation protein DsbB